MKNKQISLICYLFIELYIYIMLICFNSHIDVRSISYASIFLCLVMALCLYCKTKDYKIMICALFFTLLSDTFLILIPNLKLIGMFFFNIVQIMYFLRIYIDSDKKSKKLNIYLRLISAFLLLIIAALVLKESFNLLIILSAIYYVNLIYNLFFAIKEVGLNNLFPIGLLLFLICDSFIILYELDNYITINVNFLNFLYNLPFNVSWMFYLPSQIVLTCSIFTVNKKSFSKYKEEL